MTDYRVHDLVEINGEECWCVGRWIHPQERTQLIKEGRMSLKALTHWLFYSWRGHRYYAQDKQTGEIIEVNLLGSWF